MIIFESVGNDDIRTFGLDRIVSPAVTDNHFRKDMDVDIAERFRRSHFYIMSVFGVRKPRFHLIPINKTNSVAMSCPGHPNFITSVRQLYGRSHDIL
ncbi:MAG: WYL domain-containing protein [Prevotella sp.]|jgi:hypothetical protein|nr:WYL domain-containing protein [Prevotella sp.]